MMRYRGPFLLVLLLFSARGLLAQQPFTVLSGKVTDAATGLPLPFAGIRLKGGGAGTISNAGGNFVFKLPAGDPGDTLTVSCIGYRSLDMALPPREGPQTMNLALQPAAILLPEVSVYAPDGLAILREAIARIPDNYDTADARLTAFYREDLRFMGDTLNFNESVLDIYKTFSQDKDHQDQIRIIKGRKKPVDHTSDPQLYNWLGNIMNTAYSSLHEDLQKYHDAKHSILNADNLRFYRVAYRETLREGARQLLVLDITPRKDSRRALARATVYIDEASKAIARIELEATPRGIAFTNRHGKGGIRYTIMSKVVKATFDFRRLRVIMTYAPFRGKWYLSTLRRHWDVDINSRSRNIVHAPWTGDFTLVVTDIRKDSLQRFGAGASDRNSSMNGLIGNDYDAAFWEHYNIVQPDLPDSLLHIREPAPQKEAPDTTVPRVSGRRNGFTHADTLRGMLSPLRSCYDVTFYHLDVDVDMDSRSLRGSNSIRFRVLQPFNTMQVDLYAQMPIDSILYRGNPLAYTREADAVFVRFPDTLAAGGQQALTIYYHGRPQTPDRRIPMNGGVLWDHDDLGNPWVQMVCQGSGASLWWPNKDHLSDEPDSMRIWITVPEGFTEISNGRLTRKTPMGSGRMRYEWLVSYPINNYNATFGIGKYAHYTDRYAGLDTLTIDYYVMPYNLERARHMFRQVKPMLDCYEKFFGPYPFPRDGFTLVESLYPMEHQSGVCIGRIKPDTDTSLSPVLWHEAAHEWWGNAISCKDMADLWIHEGFANYAEALMMEYLYGKEAGLEYLNEQRDAVGNREPVVGVYDVNHIFYDISDMYTKGSLMLNTFRYVLDDDSRWFALLRDIQQRFRYKTLSSEDLVQYICLRCGKDYAYFFDQYLHYAALPLLQIAMQEQGGNLVLRYRWQAEAPGFRMPVKVTTSVDRFGFIYPGPEWKNLVLRHMTMGDFEVDRAHFFIAVEERVMASARG